VFHFEFLTKSVTNQKIQTRTRPVLGRLGTPGLEGRTRGRTLVTGSLSELSPILCRRGRPAGWWRAPL